MPAAGEIDSMTFMLVLASLGLALAVAVRARPRWGLVAFVVMLCFVPPWLGVTVKVFLTPADARGRGHGRRALAWRAHPAARSTTASWRWCVGVVVVCFIGGYIDLMQTYARRRRLGHPVPGRPGGRCAHRRPVRGDVHRGRSSVSSPRSPSSSSSPPRNFFAAAPLPATTRTRAGAGSGSVAASPGSRARSATRSPSAGALALAVPFVWTSRLPAAVKGRRSSSWWAPPPS